MRQRGPSKVYFIRPIGMDGPIKIGSSTAPGVRRDSLDTWSPFPLEIAAEIDGDLLLEQRFQARFFKQHLRLEWFEWSPELEATIAEINAGTFDIESLPLASGPVAGMADRLSRWEPIDYRYYMLWRRYCDRPVSSGWCDPYPPNGSIFARLSPEKKQVAFAALEQFLAQKVAA